MDRLLYFADVCVICGCPLPEGEIICNICKSKIDNKNPNIHKKPHNHV